MIGSLLGRLRTSPFVRLWLFACLIFLGLLVFGSDNLTRRLLYSLFCAGLLATMVSIWTLSDAPYVRIPIPAIIKVALLPGLAIMVISNLAAYYFSVPLPIFGN